MKSIMKKIYTFFILLTCCLACTPTFDLNEVEYESRIISQKRSANSINHALIFDSLAQADSMLLAMQSIENATEFYNTYIRNSSIQNKYLTSIHEYLSILNTMAGGDTITAMLAFEALQDDLLNVYVDGEDTIVEPLSYYDYRCLVNEENVFVVNDRVYHLFDTLFISCPLEDHTELINISNDPLRFTMLINQLKTQHEDIPSVPRALTNRGAFELIFADWRQTENRENHVWKYEKTVDKYRMQVSIGAEAFYSTIFNRHDLKTMYMVKNHKKCLGIWWIKNELINVDINYLALFTYGSHHVEEVSLSKSIAIDSTYTVKGFIPSYKRVISYPETYFGHITKNIYNLEFTISNPYMTITKLDIKRNN